MACGLMDHNGDQREYARTSENSQPSMRNAYGSTARYSETPSRQAKYN